MTAATAGSSHDFLPTHIRRELWERRLDASFGRRHPGLPAAGEAAWFARRFLEPRRGQQKGSHPERVKPVWTASVELSLQ